VVRGQIFPVRRQNFNKKEYAEKENYWYTTWAFTKEFFLEEKRNEKVISGGTGPYPERLRLCGGR
jgi:hypothetical protein